MYTSKISELKNQKATKQAGTLIALALALLIGFFFTQDQYYRYVENSDILDKAKAENLAKKSTLDEISALGGQDGNGGKIQSDGALKDAMERFAGTFREDAILESIFATGSNVSISNISITKGEKLPSGLSMADITIALRAQDVLTLNNYLEYLTEKKDNKKSYVIKNIGFPLDTTRNEPLNVSLNLGMYYFD